MFFSSSMFVDEWKDKTKEEEKKIHTQALSHLFIEMELKK